MYHTREGIPMKQMVKVLLFAVLFLLCAAGCSADKMDLYEESPPVLPEIVREYYDSIGITDEVRANAEAVYITYDLHKPLQIRLPEYWESLFLILYESHDDSVESFSLHDKYNHDYYNAHNPYAEQHQIHCGSLWTISIYPYDHYNETHVQKFPESADQIIGANSAIIGSDNEYIYLVSLPTDVQFIWEDDLAKNIYETSMNMREKFVDDFLQINNITKNEAAPPLN